MITNGEDYDLPPEGTRVRLVGLKNPSLNGKVGTISNYARDGERVMISLDDGPGIVKVKPKQIEELFDDDDYNSDNSGRGGGGGGHGRGGGRRGGRGGGGRHHNGMRRQRSDRRMNGYGRGDRMRGGDFNESNRSMNMSKGSSTNSRNSNQNEEMIDILRSADAMFEIADTSGDGVLTFDEFEFYMRKHTDHDIKEIIHCFETIDVDGNGDITRDEVRTAFLKKKKEVDGKSMGQADMDMLRVSRDADKFFDQADVDGNGTLSKNEFMVYMKRKTDHSEKAIADLFLMMDVDHDGYITKEEVRKVYMQERQQHLAKGDGGGETLAILLGLEDEDMEKLEEDVYNMFFLAEVGSQAYWFSLFVWLLKLALIYIIAYDLYTTEVSPHATSRKYHTANMMRMIDGLSFLFINTTLLLQATGILGMFLNFAALGFLQTIDNIALKLAANGYLSDKLEEVADSVRVMKLPRNSNECLQVMDSVFMFLVFLILVVAWALVAFVLTQ